MSSLGRNLRRSAAVALLERISRPAAAEKSYADKSDQRKRSWPPPYPEAFQVL
jgi:hypothetical protein